MKITKLSLIEVISRRGRLLKDIFNELSQKTTDDKEKLHKVTEQSHYRRN